MALGRKLFGPNSKHAMSQCRTKTKNNQNNKVDSVLEEREFLFSLFGAVALSVLAYVGSIGSKFFLFPSLLFLSSCEKTKSGDSSTFFKFGNLLTKIACGLASCGVAG